jgi:hypothetical protein
MERNHYRARLDSVAVIARDMAQEAWNIYCKTWDPDLKREFGERYVFLADVRDLLYREMEK